MYSSVRASPAKGALSPAVLRSARTPCATPRSPAAKQPAASHGQDTSAVVPTIGLEIGPNAPSSSALRARRVQFTSSSSMATVLTSPLQGMVAGFAAEPLVLGTACATVAGAVAASRTLGVSRREVESLLAEANQELARADQVMVKAERQLEHRVAASLKAAERAEMVTDTTLSVESSRPVPVALPAAASMPALPTTPVPPATPVAPAAAQPAPPRPATVAVAEPVSPSARSSNGGSSPDASKVNSIMGKVTHTIDLLNQEEVKHQQRKSPVQPPAPAQDVATTPRALQPAQAPIVRSQDSASPPSPERKASPSASNSKRPLPWAEQKEAAPKPSPWESFYIKPPSSLPPRSNPSALPVPPHRDPKQKLTDTQIKCRLLDVVYGTTRGVTASLDERGEAEEIITILEGRNPNTVVTDALEVLHGRWKLVYTTNTQTLMLLNAIQALPLVDIGDVYQVVDGANLIAHNKIDLAMPLLMSLRADTGFEVRTPHSFKVRFHSVGLETYIETPQLIASLDVPEKIEVLGQTIDLTPLKQYVFDPVQSGLGTATELMRRAASPEFQLPANEFNSLWMLTTYLDDTLRVSRDDNGGVFVMLREL